MSSKRLISLCTALFLFVTFSFLAYQRQHKPRIFILHSYNKAMPWVQSLNQGIKNVFDDKAYISLRYFYMDTKHFHSHSHKEHIRKALHTIITSWRPDIIIAFDEDAQKLAAQEFGNSNVKIILGGIIDNKAWSSYESITNITGITEQIPIRAIREILSLIFRHQKRIYYLSDDSTTAKIFDKSIINNDWGSYELVTHKRVKTLNQWKAAVHEAESKADILLISTYQTIMEEKKPMSPKRLVHWTTKHSRIPAVGIYESFVVDGGMLAIAISSLEQSYTAAWLALNIVEKKLAIENIPLIHGKTFSLFMRKEKLLQRFPIVHIPVILDTFSQSRWSMESPSLVPDLDITTIAQNAKENQPPLT